jgi:amylo-alpha-1,6-glucosidase
VLEITWVCDISRRLVGAGKGRNCPKWGISETQFGTKSRFAKEQFTLMLRLKDYLADGGLGHISEIFDGDAPRRPCGCVAQAWSVAEILRAYVEDVKGIRPAQRSSAGSRKLPHRSKTEPRRGQVCRSGTGA